MADATAESPPGSQIHPILRQRMLNRAATYSEGAQPPTPRRRSSMLSQHSDTRHSFRSSNDDVLQSLGGKSDMERLTTTDEVSLWHSAPLVFAIVPAFAGLLFQDGGAVATDILLLGFGSLFLNWCVRTPWEWYHAAQHTRYVDYDEPERYDHTILEEDELGADPVIDRNDASAPEIADTAPSPEKDKEGDGDEPPSQMQVEAREELRRNEMLALCTCFIGPLVGAYMLHAIRAQLTRPAEGLVSNYNLTIFVMGAELRPVSHVIKMMQARMLHLQRVVRSDSRSDGSRADIQDISSRLANLETSFSSSPQSTDIETLKIGATVRDGMQPQLDALNRAVRRYEKRQAAQSMQLEARFQELDSRMRDALALAAAAARTGQRPGMLSMLLTWLANLITLGLRASWAVATWPYRIMLAIVDQMKTYVTSGDRQPRKRVYAQSAKNSYAAVSTSRMQSRNGR